jgi:hypothetical protein
MRHKMNKKFLVPMVGLWDDICPHGLGVWNESFGKCIITNKISQDGAYLCPTEPEVSVGFLNIGWSNWHLDLTELRSFEMATCKLAETMGLGRNIVTEWYHEWEDGVPTWVLSNYYGVRVFHGDLNYELENSKYIEGLVDVNTNNIEDANIEALAIVIKDVLGLE